MTKGTVARIMDKGFGFIRVEGRDKDLFFHMNELRNIHFDDLQEGDELEFEVVSGEKGDSAVNISKID